MAGIALPDDANFAFGDAPIPDNFIDDTVQKAMTQHQRKESQMASVEEDFAKVLDQNVASNIAANLIGYIHEESKTKNFPTDPDEDDTRTGDEPTNDENEYTLDDMLVDAVTSHKHRESRTDFVEAKLHQMFPQNEDDDDDILLDNGQTTAGGVTDMSVIASNLVSFLHDEPSEDATATATATTAGDASKKARGSTDLSNMQQEIDRLQSKVHGLEKQLKTEDSQTMELNHRIKQLEDTNHNLMNEIRFLQHSKTTLAMSTTKCIDELRSILIQYQKHIKIDQ